LKKYDTGLEGSIESLTETNGSPMNEKGTTLGKTTWFSEKEKPKTNKKNSMIAGEEPKKRNREREELSTAGE